MALSYAILAALVERPHSGYELAKRFDSPVEFVWSASHQQIYRELTKLEGQGYVGVEHIQQDSRPNKKLYSLTDAGKAALQAWMVDASPASPIKDELLIKLLVGHIVSREALISIVRQRYRQHRTHLDLYQTKAQQYGPAFSALSDAEKFHYMTLRAGIHHETARLAWCEDVIRFLGG
ncbi:MAG: PadR family transcriptional regulator [Cyanobacteria bacterium P01_G01_bin.38]